MEQHCHWSFEIGDYQSMFNYRSPEEAKRALGAMGRPGKVIIRHGEQCTCDRAGEV